MNKKTFFGILLSLVLMTGMMSALSITVYADDPIEYGVWVGETQVTSEHLSDEHWSYDPASNVLTLDGFTYSDVCHQWTGWYTCSAAIYSENNLTIKVKGNNSIENTSEVDYGYTIYVDKSLTIEGDGILYLPKNADFTSICADEITVNDATVETYGNYGFDVYSSLTINDATVKSYGDRGFDVAGDLTINGGNITADSSSFGIHVDCGDLVINDATVSATGNKRGAYVEGGKAFISSSEVELNGDIQEGIRLSDGKLKINDSSVISSSKQKNGIYAKDLEVNGGRLEAIGSTDQRGIYIEDGDAVINEGTVIASGKVGIYADHKIYFNGGDVTASGTASGVGIGRKVVLSDKAKVMAGENEEKAEDVTATFVKKHDQKWVHVVVTPDPTPSPSDPTAVGTVHGVPSGIGMYAVTSADTVSLAKAPNKKSYTVPATVTLNGKIFNVTGIQAGAFKGTKCNTLTVKSKGLTKASVKGSLKGSKVKTVKVKVGKKKENRKYVKKYRKIFKKKNSGKKVTVK